ncbi:serine/threonine-protein kinase ATM-like [Vicia villosa]|uniref:serine/threonine-protein kinase ATM-like n=1 Tax=Vicia villosa TaxID=3911 RepID=UPI00273C086D|nr:serine/threonine-protein kinase ATM-like [Vicia villosa]
MTGAMDVSESERENVECGSQEKKTDDTPGMGTSQKTRGGADSRCRKRSKYLSYPYTNSEPRLKSFPAETEESKTPSPAPKAKASSKTSKATNGSLSSNKLGGTRFQNNWYRKFISCSKMSSSPKFFGASSSDLLSGLHSLAVGSMSPIKDKRFDMVEWFFCKYRISKYHDETELATSLFNLNEGKTSKPVDNGVMDTKSEKKKKNTQTENAARRKMKSLSGLSSTNTNVSTGDCTGSEKKSKQKRKVEEITSQPQLQNAETTSQNHNFPSSEKKIKPKKRPKLEAAQEHQGAQSASHLDAKRIECNSLVVDLQVIPPPMSVNSHQKSNGEIKEEQVSNVSNPKLRVSQSQLDGNVTPSNLLGSTSKASTVAPEEGLVGNITNHNMLNDTTSVVDNVSINKTGMEVAPEERPRKIPDLNSISFETCSTRKESENVNLLSPELQSQNPRSLSACSRITKAVNLDRVDIIGESPGTFLFLQFAQGPGVDIPSNEDLLKTFCQFGPLKATETHLIKDNTSAQIVFVNNTDATEALRSLEHNKPFGATLVGYRLHYPPAVAAPPLDYFRTPIQPSISMSMSGETPPPIQVIKQKLQMMSSVLENSGNNLSPETRAKLENEINNLLGKVNSRTTRV